MSRDLKAHLPSASRCPSLARDTSRDEEFPAWLERNGEVPSWRCHPKVPEGSPRPDPHPPSPQREGKWLNDCPRVSYRRKHRHWRALGSTGGQERIRQLQAGRLTSRARPFFINLFLFKIQICHRSEPTNELGVSLHLLQVFSWTLDAFREWLL